MTFSVWALFSAQDEAAFDALVAVMQQDNAGVSMYTNTLMFTAYSCHV